MTSGSAGSGGSYLAYCEAGFAERRIADVQVILAKPRGRPREPAASQKPGRAQVIGGVVA